jgi:hypothetical protein
MVPSTENLHRQAPPSLPIDEARLLYKPHFNMRESELLPLIERRRDLLRQNVTFAQVFDID